MSVVVLGLRPYVIGLPTLPGVVAAGGVVWAVLAVLSGAVDPRKVQSTLR